MQTTYALLRQAVLERKQVTCIYQGLHREICPHCIGQGKRGEQKVLSFQFAGSSSKGLPPGGQWRCMDVADISNVVLRDGEWHTGHSHLKPQTCVKTVDVQAGP